jgi:hypothetical protein
MLATLNKIIIGSLVIVAAATLISCATEKKQVSVVNDPTAPKGENAIPWNQQQKWEQGAEMGGLAEGTDHVR